MPTLTLICEANERRVLLLAEQLARHIPEAQICGIVHVTRPRLTSLLRLGLQLIGNTVACWALRLVHGGGPRQSNTFLSQLGKHQGDIGNVVVTRCIDDPEVFKFVSHIKPDLIITLGIRYIPQTIAVLPSIGVLRGEISNIDGSVHDQGCKCEQNSKAQDKGRLRIEIKHTANAEDSLVASFDLDTQPLDSRVSLDLKSELILRDLLVQSAAAFVQQGAGKPSDRVRAWAAVMLPSCFDPRHCATTEGIRDSVPPLRARSVWKLCIYSFFLLSPSILLRNWFRRRRRQHPIVFLTSHLISDREHRMSLPTEAFYRVVRFLKGYYRIVSLSEAVRLLESGNIDEPTVVLTFDDGYEDNFVNLRAVSEETGVPVVLFVSSDPVTERRGFAHDYERGLKGFPALSWDQIRYWAADGTEFQSHSCSHFDCGSADEVLLEREMVRSKRILEEQLGGPVTSFAFPFGKPQNMSAPAVAIAGQTYDHFLSCFGGENYPGQPRNLKHLFRKHLQGNAWESELVLQDIFEISVPWRTLIRSSRRRRRRADPCEPAFRRLPRFSTPAIPQSENSVQGPDELKERRG